MRLSPILFLTFLLVCVSVSADPPFITSGAGTPGYFLDYPQYGTYPPGEDINIHLHVFNLTNNVLINNTMASCYIELFSHTGTTLVPYQLMTREDHNWAFMFGSQNFSDDNYYSFSIYCNNTHLGGYSSLAFKVSQRDINDATGGISVIVFVLTISLFVFFLPLIIDPFVKKEGLAWDITNLILKRSCWLIATYLMMLNTALMVEVADRAGLDVNSEMFSVYLWGFGLVGWVLMTFIIVSTIYSLTKLLKVYKEIERVDYG